ncbi:hypothetical protein CEXT_729961 [Caerostris extrusa]|uniref:Uncharacterized protein n=1 Tax=Caerostris extrusa TaxID=172846 RepID=A0AAV4PCJ1_CAEEX|nr:hypothetical protein CEXT_729961 [Caerostris extrusa]
MADTRCLSKNRQTPNSSPLLIAKRRNTHSIPDVDSLLNTPQKKKIYPPPHVGALSRASSRGLWPLGKKSYLPAQGKRLLVFQPTHTSDGPIETISQEGMFVIFCCEED